MKIKTPSFNLAVYMKGNQDSDKLALVLPGRLDTKDYKHMHSHVDYLADMGYLALSFDPPGTWESDGDISLYSMTNYKKAIDELIAYFGNKPTLLVGHSRGGSMAILVGTNNDAVTHIVPIMSWYTFTEEDPGTADPEWKEKGYKINKRDLPEDNDKHRSFKLPFSFFEDQIQYDMTHNLKTSSVNKLFILGKHDNTVPPKIVRKSYELAADPKELRKLNSDHNYRFDDELIAEVNKMIGEFLEV